jgi:3-mercaptopropionate dioxygenase
MPGTISIEPKSLEAPAFVVETISRAVRQDRVTALAEALASLRRAGMLEEDDWYLPPLPDRYSRKLVCRDPRGRFVIIGMSWAPGQGSPLHDHGGLWGSEIVVSGTMRETLYSLVERDAHGRYRFRETKERVAIPGTVSTLAPPLEYHAYGNAGATVARTLHVYCGDMSRAQRFMREHDEWYRATTVELRYDG